MDFAITYCSHEAAYPNVLDSDIQTQPSWSINLVCCLILRSTSVCMTRLPPKGMSSLSRNLFKFRKITDNISLTMQDIVAKEV